ncbi:MAG: Hsp20/alpha crystallin family protein [Gammaproteobacteria bacterium]|nr:Hsp20/alpha crystallin family protein [Gammaproteobacteria bacterium]MDH5651710.1 Hsp20/alpha crystallin family protein [Gammaproteobacteria bacterium]
MVTVKKREAGNVTPIEQGATQPTEGTSKGLHPIDEMNRFFDNFLHRNWMRPANWEWPDLGHLQSPFGGKLPKMDVIDRDNEMLIRAEIPGVNKEDLDVTLTGNTVTIKGKTRHEEKEEKDNYYRSEIAYGAFQRSMMLPAEVDTDKVRADYKDGMLELTIPKLVKNSQKIEIK